MGTLKLSRNAMHFIEALPSKHFKQVWLKVLKLLIDPFPHDYSQLKGYPCYRIDIGEYRVIYEANEDVVAIILIGKRNDGEVYRQLQRK